MQKNGIVHCSSLCRLARLKGSALVDGMQSQCHCTCCIVEVCSCFVVVWVSFQSHGFCLCNNAHSRFKLCMVQLLWSQRLELYLLPKVAIATA